MCPRARWTMLLATTMTLACKSNDHCPGLCPTENPFPTMMVETADGSASIARAKIVSGPCTSLLLRSAMEAGIVEGYAAVQVTYGGSLDVPPLCLLELTSIQGEVQVVTGEIATSSYQQTCCPQGRCCDPKAAVSSHRHVEFKEPLETVPFTLALDGGVGEGIDAFEGVDGTMLDASDPVDAEAVEANAIETSTSEAFAPSGQADAAVDQATEDAPGSGL